MDDGRSSIVSADCDVVDLVRGKHDIGVFWKIFKSSRDLAVILAGIVEWGGFDWWNSGGCRRRHLDDRG